MLSCDGVHSPALVWCPASRACGGGAVVVAAPARATRRARARSPLVVGAAGAPPFGDDPWTAHSAPIACRRCDSRPALWWKRRLSHWRSCARWLDGCVGGCRVALGFDGARLARHRSPRPRGGCGVLDNRPRCASRGASGGASLCHDAASSTNAARRVLVRAFSRHTSPEPHLACPTLAARAAFASILRGGIAAAPSCPAPRAHCVAIRAYESCLKRGERNTYYE